MMNKFRIFTPLWLTALFFLGTLPLMAQEWRNSVVTDPAISTRCEALAKERVRRLEHKQKLMALEKRNLNTQKATPENKKSLKKQLNTHLAQVRNELRLVLLKIEQLEENIIRKGCPGIRF